MQACTVKLAATLRPVHLTNTQQITVQPYKYNQLGKEDLEPLFMHVTLATTPDSPPLQPTFLKLEQVHPHPLSHPNKGDRPFFLPQPKESYPHFLSQSKDNCPLFLSQPTENGSSFTLLLPLMHSSSPHPMTLYTMPSNCALQRPQHCCSLASSSVTAVHAVP